MNSTIPRFEGLLLDLDGTIYVGDVLLSGVEETLNALRRRDVPIRFLTNTTSKPRSLIVSHARNLGLSIDPAHLYTPPMVAREVLHSAGHTRCHFLLKPEVISDVDGIAHVDEAPDAVVVGDMGDLFSAECLDRALRFLLDGAAFYTLAQNRYYRATAGLRLDVGAYTAALEYASRKKAVLLGKPAAHFFNTAVAGMGLNVDRVLMVGDDIEGDIMGAQNAGIRGVLVKTGKFRESDLERGIKPDAVIESFAQFGQ